MITAIVRYPLPPSIDREACRAHYAAIAPGFQEVRGLISKHFIWSEQGYAGGVYQWESKEAAQAFYSGPWRKGIVERYGAEPEIEYFEVFCITNNADKTVQTLQAA
jgi:hypothetical protein